MSTTINPENYNWTVTNAVAKPVNPYPYNYGDDIYPSREWDDFDDKHRHITYHTNAPNRQYPGDAFEVAKEYKHPYGAWLSDTQPTVSNSGYERRVYLYIKRSHLPQVLTEADYNSWTEGGELKELYKEVWKYRYSNTETWIEEWPSTYKNFDNNFDQYVKADKTGRFEYSREYRLNNTPAVQEAETVEDNITNLKAENAVLKVNQKKYKAEIADLNKQVEALRAGIIKAANLGIDFQAATASTVQYNTIEDLLKAEKLL